MHGTIIEHPFPPGKERVKWREQDFSTTVISQSTAQVSGGHFLVVFFHSDRLRGRQRAF
jgi:hypothetical protein